MLAHLALASVAVVEPLEEAILVNEFDASAASARVSQGVILLPRIPADPADVTLVFLLFKPRNRRSQTWIVGDLLHRGFLPDAGTSCCSTSSFVGIETGEALRGENQVNISGRDEEEAGK